MINGPELMTAILGESEAGVQAIYIAARAIAPTVVFIDEVDAFAPARSGMSSTGGGSASDTSGRVLSTLLVEMQGTPITGGQPQPYAATSCEGWSCVPACFRFRAAAVSSLLGHGCSHSLWCSARTYRADGGLLVIGMAISRRDVTIPTWNA